MAMLSFLCVAAQAQVSTSHGGAAGADLTLDAIGPTVERIEVGLAGEDPADIARYLLASGANAAEISPDGETVAFSLRITGAPQLWSVPAAGGQARQLTFGNGITFLRWMADGSGLVYGADNDGNERPAFYLVSPDGTDERLILPAAESGFRRFGDSTDDGRVIVYSSAERNGVDFDIYRATLAGQSERVFEGRFAFYAHEVSPDGAAVIVTESIGEDSDNLYLLDLASGRIDPLSIPDPRASHSLGGFAWEANSAGFLFAGNQDREFSALMRYDLERNEISILETAERDIENVVLCGPEGRYLAWTVNVDGFYKLYVRDRATSELLDTPELPEGVYELSCSGRVARLTVRIDSWRTPGEIWVWDLVGGATEIVFAASLAGLDRDRLVRPESIHMTARDGVELQGLLYMPDSGSRRGDGAPPVMFLVHGGPTAQAQPTFDGVVQYHVDRGVAVFAPNVRGSTGFGRTYVTLDDRERRLDSVRDLVDMLEGLDRTGLVDAGRAAVVGGSYGGYMVNAVLANYPSAFSAGVSLYGVSDWVKALEIASPDLKASDRIEYGDISEQRWRDFYRENSPIRQADRIRAPVLYSHGVMDPRIDIAETEAMVRALRSNGIEAPFIRIPDEGHGWRKLHNRLFYYRRQANFIEGELYRER